MNNLLILFLFKVCYCDWVSEWLSPVQYQYKELKTQNGTDNENNYEKITKTYDFMPQISESFKAIESDFFAGGFNYEEDSLLTLKTKLEEVLRTAAGLVAVLKKEINIVEERERNLKEAIANGRSGTTVLSVTAYNKAPRTYFIRNSLWTLCNGFVQYPIGNAAYNIYSGLFSAPRCIGQEVISKRDPCVYNSVIKYETIPVARRAFYVEDEYLCLKTSFNNTLETYMTVPKRVVYETCGNGTITSLKNNIFNCGVRTLSEYTYYPTKEELTLSLPLEYCSQNDGSCNLMVGWHVSNKTIENFEFFKNDQKFKKFFLKTNYFESYN